MLKNYHNLSRDLGLSVLAVSLLISGCAQQKLITGEPLLYRIHEEKGQVVYQDAKTDGWIFHKGEVITLMVSNVFIKFLKDFANPHVLVYTEVYDVGNDDPSLAFRKVIYNGDNTPQGVNLGVTDRIVYGPTQYKGLPIRIKFFIVELDKEQKKLASDLINAAGTVAQMGAPQAASSVGIAVELAQALNELNEDDFELRFDLTLNPIGPYDPKVEEPKSKSKSQENGYKHNGSSPSSIQLATSLKAGSLVILKRELPSRVKPSTLWSMPVVSEVTLVAKTIYSVIRSMVRAVLVVPTGLFVKTVHGIENFQDTDLEAYCYEEFSTTDFDPMAGIVHPYAYPYDSRGDRILRVRENVIYKGGYLHFEADKFLIADKPIPKYFWSPIWSKISSSLSDDKEMGSNEEKEIVERKLGNAEKQVSEKDKKWLKEQEKFRKKFKQDPIAGNSQSKWLGIRARTCDPKRPQNVILHEGRTSPFNTRTYAVLTISPFPEVVDKQTLRNTSNRDLEELQQLLDETDALVGMADKAKKATHSLIAKSEYRRLALLIAKQVSRSPSIRVRPEYLHFWIRNLVDVREDGSEDKDNHLEIKKATNHLVLSTISELAPQFPINSFKAISQSQIHCWKETFQVDHIVPNTYMRGLFSFSPAGMKELKECLNRSYPKEDSKDEKKLVN